MPHRIDNILNRRETYQNTQVYSIFNWRIWNSQMGSQSKVMMDLKCKAQYFRLELKYAYTYGE